MFGWSFKRHSWKSLFSEKELAPVDTSWWGKKSEYTSLRGRLSDQSPLRRYSLRSCSRDTTVSRYCDRCTRTHTSPFLVSLKIHQMASNSNANNCALCSKLVFLFEPRVKTKDLEEQERAALMLIPKNPDFPKLLETDQSILCMSCYRKVKAGNENGQQGGECCTRQLLFIHWYDIRWTDM